MSENQTRAKVGDLIEYKHYGRLYQEIVIIVMDEGTDEESYGVYADYGQDFIFFEYCKIVNQ